MRNTKKKAKQYFDIVRNKFAAPHERKESMDLDALGVAIKAVPTIHIEVDTAAKTGFKGLPKEWVDLLSTAGVSEQEIYASPRAAMEVASIQFQGGLAELFNHHRSLKGKNSMRLLMKQAVNIKTTDPRKYYNVQFDKDRIGGGSFGEVFRCFDKLSGEKLAMKVSTSDKLDILEREIRMHALTNGHRNIVDFREAFNFKKKIFLVVEFMDAGSLFDFIYDLPRPIKWKEKAITYVLRGMLKGLDHMHARNHLHRDIKSQNILFSSRGEVKIADFGFAVGLTREQKKRKTVLGSPFWMAPELIGKEAYGPGVDIWATAITAFEMAQNEPPHMGESAVRVLFLIRSQPAPLLSNKSKWSSLFRHFLQISLEKNPSKRPSASDLLMHPVFFKSKCCKRRQFSQMLAEIKDLNKSAF